MSENRQESFEERLQRVRRRQTDISPPRPQRSLRLLTVIIAVAVLGLVAFAFFLPPLDELNPLVDTDDELSITGQDTCEGVDALPGTVEAYQLDGVPSNAYDVRLPVASGDIYGWDGTAWQFIPSQPEDNNRLLQLTTPFECLAVVNVPNEQPLVDFDLSPGETRREDITPLYVRGIHPTLAGTLQGILPAGLSGDVIPLITNYRSPALVDVDSMTAILGNPEARQRHAAEIAAFADVGEYEAVALDYRAIPDDYRSEMADFIQRTAANLQRLNKRLIVVVSEADAYDWRAIGQAADEVIVRLSPTTDIESLLQWAVGEVNRRKLSLQFSAFSVTNEGRLVTLSEAVAGLGQAAVRPNVGYLIPEADMIFSLNTPYTIEFGVEGNTPFITYSRDDTIVHRIWVMTEGTAAHRIGLAEAYNLKGVLITDIHRSSLNDLEGDVQPLILQWKAYNLMGNVLADGTLLPGDTVTYQPPADEPEIIFEFLVDTVPVGRVQLTHQSDN
jgi:hypothetical protein